jgi:glycosyltransferase involved in cell wall biosynthesis
VKEEWKGQRWLLINVFFWPDAVGGATRVAMDQARELVEAGAEVTVLCSARSSRGDYSVDVTRWEGCRVVRLHAPLKPWHHHTDEGCYGFMDRWLEREWFDQVHAHCIQVLTGDVLLPALERSLPVAVSLHDGWWLGRHMFFTSITGRSIRPGDWLDDLDLPESQLRKLLSQVSGREELEKRLESLWTLRFTGIERFKAKMRQLQQIDEEEQSSRWKEASENTEIKRRHEAKEQRLLVEKRDTQEERQELEGTRSVNRLMEEAVEEQSLREMVYEAYCRHRDLTVILARAEHRLAVSSAFAEVYRQAGIADVAVRENVSLPVTHLPRLRLEDEKGTVFGFFGGWSLHKGIGVLENACRLYRGPACSLLAIHEAAKVHNNITYMWGMVMVKLIAPVPLDEVAELYARIDVLIAPSTWPESFGLITREAISAGKDVIASDIGALALGLSSGAHLLSIPPNDSRALASAMERMAQHLGIEESKRVRRCQIPDLPSINQRCSKDNKLNQES